MQYHFRDLLITYYQSDKIIIRNENKYQEFFKSLSCDLFMT
jgi:hypothetical protein